jgi:hypothetical protein
MKLSEKIKNQMNEYNADHGTSYEFKEFFFEVLGFTQDDWRDLFNTVHKKKNKKPSGESKHKNIVPYIPENIGDRENPEYEKYRDMVYEFRKYMCNPEITTDRNMRGFMKYQYGLEGDAATYEMRKIENIVYKGHKSKSEKRNKRREKREKEFNVKFNL